MFSRVISSGNMGLDGYVVHAECDVGNGMPVFDIVGLGDSAVKESRERVRSAIRNSGFEFPVRRITVNLAPANRRKEGSVFDLAIAFGILASTGQMKIDRLGETMVLGELALDGGIRHVTGLLPMVFRAAEVGLKRVFVPWNDAAEAALIRGTAVIPVRSLREAVGIMNGTAEAVERRFDEGMFTSGDRPCDVDFADIKGQICARRALEIAAAGGHNLLMTGPPGAGKTMLARSIAGILPEMEPGEAIEVTRIYSVAGLLKKERPVMSVRPFRNPHFGISASSLVGGGKIPKPGEVSLAHNGVLFLDEIAEFSIDALNSLRQPLEDGRVCISRVYGTLTFPANAMLVAAANPCKCGFGASTEKECVCTAAQLNAYKGKLSGPLLDRIDILLEIPKLEYGEMTESRIPESSSAVRDRVKAARKIQTKRYGETGIFTNARMTRHMMEEACELGPKAERVMKETFERFSLSARSYSKILKVARTAADLDGSEKILDEHVKEAALYRCFEKRQGA